MANVKINTLPIRPRSIGGVILGRPNSSGDEVVERKLSNVMMEVDFGDFGCLLADPIPLEIVDDASFEEDTWMEVDLNQHIEELESLNATSSYPSTPPPRTPTPLSPQPHYSHYSESSLPSSPRSPSSSFKSPSTLSFSNRGKKPYSSPRHSPRRSPPSPIQIQMSSYDAVDALKITRVQRQRPHAAALLSPVCIRSPPPPTPSKATISPSSPLAALLLQEARATNARVASSRSRFERLIEQGKQHALDREATEKVLPSLPVDLSASPIMLSFNRLILGSPTSPTTRIQAVRRSAHRQSTQPSATQAARLFATQARELDQFFGTASLPSSPNSQPRGSGFAGDSDDEESNSGLAEEGESLLVYTQATTARRSAAVDENLLPGQKLDSWDIHLESYAGGRGSSVKRLGIDCQNRDRLVSRTNASIARQYDPMLEEANHRRSIMDEHLSRRKSVALVGRKLKKVMKAMV